MSKSVFEGTFMICQSTAQTVLPALKSWWEISYKNGRPTVIVRGDAWRATCDLQVANDQQITGTFMSADRRYCFEIRPLGSTVSGKAAVFGIVSSDDPSGDVSDPGVWEAEEERGEPDRGGSRHHLAGARASRFRVGHINVSRKRIVQAGSTVVRSCLGVGLAMGAFAGLACAAAAVCGTAVYVARRSR